MKVKIFESCKDCIKLEVKLNEFLKTCNPDNIIDIKYSGAGSYNFFNDTKCYSAMVILKEESNNERIYK